MDMTGEHQINAPRAAVWAGLNDPEILKQSIPGCEEVNRLSETEMTAQVTAKVGPVKAKFSGRITLSDIDPPNGYTLNGEGQGGAAGFAKGGAKVRLEDGPGGRTLLKYEVHAQIGGKLAQIGSRLIDGAARKMADDFFSGFAAAVESRAGNRETAAAAPAGPRLPIEDATVPVGAAAAGVMSAEAGDARPARGASSMAWAGAGIVVLGLALWWFLGR
ncbi:MAG TPA: carbon monoxide dehydrogenase subunit G [Dongiaceae bacterium]|jgi:carbon monoxide dehydrogenase subunit G|nr:carbon monoxide dehydrogenase subunit G [Dongiaceae bacterium]